MKTLILAAVGLVAAVGVASAQEPQTPCAIRGSYNLVCHNSTDRQGTLGRLEFSPGFACDVNAVGRVRLVGDQRPGHDVDRRLTYALTPDEYYPMSKFSRYLTIFDAQGRELYHGIAGPFVEDRPICEGATAPDPCTDARGPVAASILLVRASRDIETCQAVRYGPHVQSWP